ncbi:hypothetical protein DYB28_008852 [Aphanomyces astaci]|uniref:CCHC-type domain-containing protein n=1 Tax=Aphanomyces astaci TaxID=112090 RepID=A0A9X8E9E9_APHAT|nr:hypothetical protein DYB28_008852 [Aphanomyces astaci]
MSDCDYQRSQSPVNGTERSRSREAERGRPVRRQATTPFASPLRPGPPTQQAVENTPENKPLKSNSSVDWLRVHTAGYHLYAPVEDEKTSAPPATAAAAPSQPSKSGRSDGSVGSSSGPPRRAPAAEQGSAKYERKNATCLKCGSESHKVVNCSKCAPGESERLLKEQMNKWESARNNKVTKLQGSANKSLGREAKIEGIVSVTVAQCMPSSPHSSLDAAT